MDVHAAYKTGYRELMEGFGPDRKEPGFFGRLFGGHRMASLGKGFPCFLLPLAVAGHRMRAGAVSDAAYPWPAPDALTREEAEAAAYLLDYIAGDPGTRADMAVARPWLMEPLNGLRSGLDDLPIRCDRLPMLDQPWADNLYSPVISAIEVVDRLIKRAPPKGAKPFEIATTDPGFMRWLQGQRDPALWHQIASGGLNWDVSRNIEVVDWIVRQPECDPATAAGVFWLLGGTFIVGKPVAEVPSSPTSALLLHICKTAPQIASRPSKFPLTSFGLDRNPRDLAAELDAVYAKRAGAGADPVPSPSVLFAQAFRGKAPVGWSVHSEIYVQRDV